MIFKKLIIKYKGKVREIEFTKKCLIFSSDNSVGKSTILRLLFWSMGYSIPGTYKIKFSDVETILFFNDNINSYRIDRKNKDIQISNKNKIIGTHYLNGLDSEWFSQIWGIESFHVVNNVLGAIYMDQDKGWTLLNRGKVIGNIPFNIRDLLIGLDNNGSDPDPLLVKLNKMDRALTNVNQLIKILDLSSTSNVEYNDEDIDKEYANLKIKKKIKINKLKKLQKQLNSESSSKEYILSSHIIIEDRGKQITVNKDNLLNVDDNIEFLKSKVSMIQQDIELINYNILQIEEKFSENTSSLFAEEDIVKDTIDKISGMKISPSFLENRKKELTSLINNLNNEIEKEFIDNNNLTEETEKWINLFAKILDVEDVVKSKKYIFTRNIKSISGTIFYKVVFCFKMAYIKVIENHTGITLPIVLDSPSGREVTDRNIESVIGILNEYFRDNQIIIASINDYNLNGVEKININKRIFE